MQTRRTFLARLGAALSAAGLSGRSAAPARLGDFSAPSSGDEGWQNVRAQFRLDPDQHFFNTGTLGSCPQPVHERVVETLRPLDACPTYHYWARCMPRYLELRCKAAALLGAPDPRSVTLTHSTTEGINIVARGLELRAGDEVVMTTHEHPGGESIWRRLESEIGIRVRCCDLPMHPPADERIPSPGPTTSTISWASSRRSTSTSSREQNGSWAGPGT